MLNFKDDVTDLFEYKRGGHVQHWLYGDKLRKELTGSELWRAFTRSSNHYYIPQHEATLIQKHCLPILENNAYDTMIDFGVGSRAAIREKTAVLIQGIKNIRHYYGIDISPTLLKNAANELKSIAPDVDVETLEGDFYEDSFHIKGKRRLGLLFGCAVSNQEMLEGETLPYEKIATNLKKFQKHLTQSSHLLVTYDSNQNASHAIAAYQNGYWSQHVKGILYDIKNTLQTGGNFTPDAWKHETIWNKNASVIHQCITAIAPQHLVLEDTEYHFSTGQRFAAVNNVKFAPDTFKHICKLAGYNIGPSANHKTLHLQDLDF